MDNVVVYETLIVEARGMCDCENSQSDCSRSERMRSSTSGVHFAQEVFVGVRVAQNTDTIRINSYSGYSVS